MRTACQAAGIAVNTLAPRRHRNFSRGMVRDDPAMNQRVAEMTRARRAGGPMIAAFL